MMPAGLDDDYAVALHALRRYETCLRDLAMQQAHPVAQVVNARGHGTAHWRWIRDALISAAPPPASAFLREGDRLGVASLPFLRRALILRALYARRTAVRRCIARDRLKPMRSALGDDVFDALVDWSSRDGETTLALPASLAPLDLAQDGIWCLWHDGTLSSMAIVQLIECRLGGLPSASPQAPLVYDPVSAAERDRFMMRLLSLESALS
jgi:hypothetical protein